MNPLRTNYGAIQVVHTDCEEHAEHPLMKVVHAWHVELAVMNSAVERHVQLVPVSCQFKVASHDVQSVLFGQAVQPIRVALQFIQVVPFMYWYGWHPQIPKLRVYGDTHAWHTAESAHCAQLASEMLHAVQLLVVSRK